MNNQEAEIPDVSGMTVNKAESTLEKEGFTVAEKTKKENSDDVKKEPRYRYRTRNWPNC